ncbi:uncharacterized protein LOC127711238 isoform X3 [Mytilus californianus]|nr:uncharacterized protein LOC127711238 isoform X3 [Mytilus californianus]
MLSRDYCDRKYQAVSDAQELFPQFLSESNDCSTDNEIILGLIGATTSSVTEEVSTKLSAKFKVPLVSYSSTASALSDNTIHPYFMRTISPDGPLMEALIRVLQELKWSFVNVVYTDDTFGRSSYNEIRTRLVAAGICLTQGVEVSSTDTSNTAMDNLLRKLTGSDSVGNIYLGASQIAESLLNRAESYSGAGKLQWIFTDSLTLSSSFTGKKYPRGVISVLPGSRKITEFEDHWIRINATTPSSENPWYKDWYMTEFDCSLPGTTNPPHNSKPPCQIPTENERRFAFVQDQFVEPAVHAVYTYANALRRAHVTKCGGVAGMCNNLKSMTTEDFYQNYLKNTDFTYSRVERVESMASAQLEPYNAPAKVKFDSHGDLTDYSFEIYSFNDYSTTGTYKFEKVGTFYNGRLEVVNTKFIMYNTARDTRLPSPPPSPCPTSPCAPCLGATSESLYMYLHGDVIMNGVYPVHMGGKEPLTCGDLYKNGAMLVEAMRWTISQANSQNLLRGVTLGGLALDDCFSSLKSIHEVTAIRRHNMPIMDSSGNDLDPDSIDGYHGGYLTGLVLPLAKLINTIKRPQIAINPTSTDNGEYPYLIHMLYGVDKLIEAYILMLKKVGWNYVQVVYDSDDFAMSFVSKFKEMAGKHGICIVASYEFSTGMTGNDMVEKLRKHSTVHPVLTISMESQINKILGSLKSQNAGDQFNMLTFILGQSSDNFDGYQDIAMGTINIKYRMPDIAAFRQYLSNLTPNTAGSANPWFPQWYETLFNCSLDTSNMRQFTSVCNKNTNVGSAPGLFYHSSVTSAIYGIYAFVFGLHGTLIEMCGQNYNGVCANYRNGANKGDKLVEKIKSVVFNVDGLTNIQFSNGEINFPLEYYYWSGPTSAWIKVGDFNPSAGTFSFSENDVQLYGNRKTSQVTSSCPMVCTQCLYTFQEQQYMYIEGDLLIPAIFDIHYKGSGPLNCGNIRVRNGFLNSEAFAYALEYINSGNSAIKLNGVKLGGVGFDGCMNSLRANAIVSAFHSQWFKKDDGRTKFALEKSVGWMLYGSETTIDVSESLGNFNIPVITPAATSHVLDDKTMFKAFFRTIPSDGNVTRAMAQLAKELNFEYIITLNAPNKESRDATEQFRKYAKAHGICIASSYEFVTDGTMDTLVEYIADSSTRIVAVFTYPDQYVEELLMAKSRKPEVANLIFMANHPWSTPVIKHTALRFADRSLMFGSSAYTTKLTKFRDYLAGKQSYPHNPWYNEFYQAFYECSLGTAWQYQSNCYPLRSLIGDKFVEDITALPTITAVMAYAEAINRVLIEKCGQNYTGICFKYYSDDDTLLRLMAHLDALSFHDVIDQMFYFIERESNQNLTIYRLDSVSSSVSNFYNEGTVKQDSISLRDKEDLKNEYLNIPATCTGDCSSCLNLGDGTEQLTYLTGDIMLVGLFDIHKAGKTPYTCGEINNKHGLQLLEAFQYAVEYVNDKHGIFANILDGVKIGYVTLDVCQSPTRAGNMIANIHSKNIELKNGNNVINPSRFDMYVGPMDSATSIRVADVLNALGIPQISYGATSLELRDSLKYRYFLRTVPADDKQARAIISYLKMFDLRNVQVIHTFNTVGDFGREEFSRLAYLNRICISQNITIGQDGEVSEIEATRALNQLNNFTDATIVILFVDDPVPLLKVIERSQDIRNKFAFIGTDKWGQDPEIWEGLDNIMREKRAIAFDVETADLRLFDQYLEYKTPETYTNNPWFKDYYEYLYGCSVDRINSPNPCPTKLNGLPRANKYIQDPYVLYVVNAVFSAALGAHDSLVKSCRADYGGVCNIFVTSGQRRQMILDGAKKAKFVDATKQPFYFTSGGESDRGYHIWEPIQQGQTYVLEDVGSYNDTHYLKVDATHDLQWTSVCDTRETCKCVFPDYQPSRYMLKESTNDLNLVYISDIHAADPYNSFACGPIDTASNFQNLMAFYYAMDLVNQNVDNRYPATLKLGGIALDTCSSASRIGQDLYSLLSGEGICGTGNEGQVISPSTVIVHLAKNSANAIATSSILSPLKMTSMSQSATSVELSSDLHDYFLRTVPPDNIQAIAMVEVIQRFGWDYMSAVYTDNAYGRAAKQTLLESAQKTSPRTCVSQAIAMPVDATLEQAKTIVDDLNQRVGARVVVLFVTGAHARLLLQAATERQLTNRFIWLGSDTWANSETIVKDYEYTAAGAITIQINSHEIENFKTYLKSLTLRDHKGIPDDWFEEIYQKLHQCRILNSAVSQSYSSICTGDEKITDDMVPQDPYVLHTIISVFMVAQGLSRIDECTSSSLSLSACLTLQAKKNDLIYNAIKNADYNVLPQYITDPFTFQFTTEGYGDVGYNILNYRRNQVTAKFEYEKLGTYQQSLNIDRSKYYGFSFVDSRNIPTSSCPVGVTCRCLNSDGTTEEIKRTGVSGISYYQLENGQYVDAQTGQIVKVEGEPDIDDRFRDIWGIIVATLAGIGVFTSLCLFIYLLVVYPNKSGTSVLGYMLIFGIIILYALIFLFIVHATRELCAMRKFLLGVGYCLCYASLFVKIVDCWRCKGYAEDKEIKYEKLGHPIGLFVCTVLLVLVQVMINAEWMILEKPEIEKILYNNLIWPRCTPNDFYDEGLILSLVYVMFLILLTIFFGIASLSNPKNHYEARWICGIAVLSVPVWVIFAIVAILGPVRMGDAAISVGLLLNATIMLFLGPMRKLYLLNKHQESLEEEDMKQLDGQGLGIDYASMYSRQYDNSPRLTEGQSYGYEANMQSGYEANSQSGGGQSYHYEEQSGGGGGYSFEAESGPGYTFEASAQSGYEEQSGYNEQRTSI